MKKNYFHYTLLGAMFMLLFSFPNKTLGNENTNIDVPNTITTNDNNNLSFLSNYVSFMSSAVYTSEVGFMAEAESFKSLDEEFGCYVEMPTLHLDGTCVQASEAPDSYGDEVEVMWLERINEEYIAMTTWSTDTALSFCTDTPGYYRMCARTVGCTDIYETTEVYISNVDCALTVNAGNDIEVCQEENIVLTATVENESECQGGCEYPINDMDRCTGMNPAEIWLNNSEQNYFNTTYNSYFKILEDGTAIYYGNVSNGYDNVDINITFTGRTTTPPSGSPKLGCDTNDTSDYIYWTNTQGTLVSEKHGTYEITRMGEAFQLGIGGDVTREGFGASGWFFLNGGDGFYENGDVNISLGECIAFEETEEVAYTWTTTDGNIVGDANQQSITVNQSGTYTVKAEDCKDCIANDEIVVTLTNAPEVTANNLTESVTVSQGENFPEVTFTNGEVISYSENDSDSLCKIELSSQDDYNWRSVFFHSFPTQYNKNFIWEDGYTLIKEDGTAEIFGKITNVDLPDSGFHLHFYFEVLEEYTEWIAGGGYENTDTNATERLYGAVDFTKPNSIVGFGAFADSDLELISTGNVAHMDYGQRDVYGGFGVGLWIDYAGTVNGMPAGITMNASGTNHVDMYAAIGECIEAPEATCSNLVVRHWVVEDACGVQTTYVQTVIVNNDVEANAGEDVSIASGASTTLTATGGDTYVWSTGETTASITVSPSETTTYSVMVTSDNGECTDADAVIVSVDCSLEVNLGEDVSFCSETETVLTATVVNNTNSASIIASYNVTDADTTNGICENVHGNEQGVMLQKGNADFPITGSYNAWKVYNELILNEYDNNTAKITGTVIDEQGKIGTVDMLLFDKQDDGTSWNASCYLDNLVGAQVFYQSFYGTITVDGISYTVEPKASKQHFVFAEGASLEPNQFGFGAWTSGTFGNGGEWFGNLEPREFNNCEDVTYLWSTGETTPSITVSPESTTTYTVTATNCDNCEATDEVTVEITSGITVNAGEDVEVCEGTEITLTANAIDNNTKKVLRTYKVSDGDTTDKSCFPTEGTGVLYTRGDGCAGSHDIWQAGDDLVLNEYSDDTATITGSLTRNGTIAELNINFSNKQNSGNTWNASCYIDGISSSSTFYQEFSGTLTYNGIVETIEKKASEQHFIRAYGAGFDPDQYGLGGWLGGSVGSCSEWFANLTPMEVEYCELTYLWSNGETTETILVSPEETTTYTVTATNCDNCEATDEVTVTVNQKVTVGDFVWVDVNQNGLQDAGETGVNGVTATLFQADGTEVASTTTANNNNGAPGAYEFEVCPNSGEYYIVFDNIPDGFVITPKDNGDDDLDSDINENGQTEPFTVEEEDITTIDAGIYAPCEISPMIQEENAICIGSQITLTASGGNSYQWKENGTEINGATSPTLTVTPNATTTYSVVVSDTAQFDCSAEISTIVTVNQKVTVGDFVWVDVNQNGLQDAGETGVNGVTATLFQADGTEVASTTTANNNNGAPGAYEFEVCPNSGEYYIVFDNIPDGFVITPKDNGDDDLDSDIDENGQTDPFIVEDEDVPTIDGGIYSPCDVTPIIEAEDPICVGTQIILTASGGDSYQWKENGTEINGATSPTLTVTPNATTTYSVVVSDTAQFDCSAEISTIVTVNQKVTVGDFVWVDVNQNGLQDAGETGVNGVTATLFQADGTEVANTTTANDNNGAPGAYEFEVCPNSGEYYIVFDNIPDGFVITPKDNGDDDLDSDINENGQTDPFTVEEEDITTIDAGIYTPCEISPMIQEENAICIGSQITLTASGGDSYQWKENGTEINGATSPTLTVTPNATTTYSVVVSDTAQFDCSAEISTIVVVNELPTANAGADETICKGDEVVLTATGGGTYLWSTGETTASIIVSPKTTSEYNVTVTSEQGCSSTDAVTVTVNDLPIANAGADQTICEGDDVVLTATGGGSYLWSTGETTDSITVSPEQTTEYTVTVNSEQGCSSTDAVTVTVNDLPIANAGADQNICEGDDVVLTATGGGSYLWSTGETTDSITVSPSITTEYGVLVISDGGCEAMDTVIVTVAEKITIGDFVFDDMNGDGVQDNEDTGMNGVTVKLFHCDDFYGNAHGDLVETVVTTNNPITGEPGYYSFEVCPNSGPYYLIFEDIPLAYEFTAQEVGNSSTDSNVNSDGVTACFDVTTIDDTSIDAGLVAKTCGMKIGSKVLPRDPGGVYTARNKDTACIGDDFYLWMFINDHNLANWDNYHGEDLIGWSFTYEFPNGTIFTQDDASKESYRTQVYSLTEEDFGTYKITWSSPDGCHGLTRFELSMGDECKENGTRKYEQNKVSMIYPVPATSNSVITVVVNTVNQSLENDEFNSDVIGLMARLPQTLETVSAVLYDSNGKIVGPSQNFRITKGRAAINYQTGYMASGNYILVISGDDWSDSKQIIIK